MSKKYFVTLTAILFILLLNASFGSGADIPIIPKPVKACFFVAGFIGLLNNPEFDELNETFSVKEFNWSKIRENCERFYLYNSDNDPYVPLEKGKELAGKLNGKLKIIKKAGHINKEFGYTKFDLLLEEIKKELK